MNPIEHEVSDVLTHDVHNEDKQNQMQLQTDNILTVDRIKIAGKMVSWGTQTDVLELESMVPIQPMTVVEYGDGKKHKDDTNNDSIPSSASQIGQMDRSTAVKQSTNAGLDTCREIYHEVTFPPVSSTAVMPSSKAVMPEPTESTGKERTPSPVDLCTSKTEVKKKKTLPTKAYKLPPACTFLQDPQDVLRSVMKPKPGEHRQMVPAHQVLLSRSQTTMSTPIAKCPCPHDIAEEEHPPADLRIQSPPICSCLGIF